VSLIFRFLDRRRRLLSQSASVLKQVMVTSLEDAPFILLAIAAFTASRTSLPSAASSAVTPVNVSEPPKLTIVSHVAEPGSAVNQSFGHMLQVESPVDMANSFFWHCSHSRLPSSACEYPSGQAWQSSVPSSYDPATHTVQVVIPLPGWTHPLGHALHVSSLSSYSPGLQILHES